MVSIFVIILLHFEFFLALFLLFFILDDVLEFTHLEDVEVVNNLVVDSLLFLVESGVEDINKSWLECFKVREVHKLFHVAWTHELF